MPVPTMIVRKKVMTIHAMAEGALRPAFTMTRPSARDSRGLELVVEEGHMILEVHMQDSDDKNYLYKKNM